MNLKNVPHTFLYEGRAAHFLFENQAAHFCMKAKDFHTKKFGFQNDFQKPLYLTKNFTVKCITKM